MKRLALSLIFLVALTGCEDKFGVAANYHPRAANPPPITMPSGAPQIGRQYILPEEGITGTGHLGIDIWTHVGTPVLAAAPGVVLRALFDPAYGRRITIDHGENADGIRMLTSYFHMSDITVAKGDRVERGQRIGASGMSGFLAGFPHLHFEVHEAQNKGLWGKPMDPNLYWRDGPGNVSCFDKANPAPERPFATTMPVRCR